MQIFELAGGLGLFIVGMIILTDGLRGLSGEALRRFLAESTQTPLRGAIAGAITTAAIQSSSATTVITIGFVSAGLLTFSQALGIIFGANIGTTLTGWLVAIVGFKLKLGTVILPLIPLGAMLKLFGRGRLQSFGWALVGFSLLIVSIEIMKQGMVFFEGVITPEDFPEDTLLGRLQLVMLGAAITIITQSSSAGVATALVALSAGIISFPQAAALVIGMDVGTTFKAALATLGGSTATRRTGYAHVIYNILTGILAFVLLGPYSAVVTPLLAGGDVSNAQIALVAFHTIFNTLGVLLVLPFTRQFAWLMQKLVPETGVPLLRRLDESLLSEPGSAADAASATVRDTFQKLSGVLADQLDAKQRIPVHPSRLDAIDEALAATRNYLEQVRTEPNHGTIHTQHVATVHALDHLFRLARRCRQERRLEIVRTDQQLRPLSELLQKEALQLRVQVDFGPAAERLDELRKTLREEQRRYRTDTIAAASLQSGVTTTTLERLDSMRWLHRVAYHLWRVCHHLHTIEEPTSVPAPEAEMDFELWEE
jgi:phosphate:Na+ symporter